MEVTFISNSSNAIALFTLVSAVVSVVLAGFRRIPFGSVAIVVTFGRRTGDIREEGITWIAPLVQSIVLLDRGERQFDIPPAQYYSSDRIRLSFKVTIRVSVTEPRALLLQGPGTYLPFIRPGFGNVATGEEERNVPLTKLVQDTIRETIQKLRSDQVLFGGDVASPIREQIRGGLTRTTQRWGLEVHDVFITDIKSEDAAMAEAFQAQSRQEFEGRGRLAQWEADIARGGLFGKVAIQVAEDIQRKTGTWVPVDQVMQFLTSFYTSERALEVAAKVPAETEKLVETFVVKHLGAPVSVPSALGTPHRRALGVGVMPGGSWTVGRSGAIEIDGDGVSRHHARLDVIDGVIQVTDLGSSNGTFVNGARVSPRGTVTVQPNDELRFGSRIVMPVNELLRRARANK